MSKQQGNGLKQPVGFPSSLPMWFTNRAVLLALMIGGAAIVVGSLVAHAVSLRAQDGKIGPLQQIGMLLGLALLIGSSAFLLSGLGQGAAWLKRAAQILKHPISTGLGLIVVLGGNYFLRRFLEQSDLYVYNYFARYEQNIPWQHYIFKASRQGFYLPAAAPMALLVSATSMPTAWYLFHALLIVVSFFVSWRVFRSRLFSFTLVICLGYGTQLFHIYMVTGGFFLPLVSACYLINLWCGYEFLRGEKRQTMRGGLFLLSLVVLFTLGVHWLDYLVFVWLACVYLFVSFWLHGQRHRLPKLAFIFATTTAAGLLFILITITYHYTRHVPGMEEDVLFNYPIWIPAVEDVISNYIQFLYMALTNFLPPVFLSSSSLYLLGPERLIELQHGYHRWYTHLVPMHYMFLWRYYAGAVFVIFAYALYRVISKSQKSFSPVYIALSLFMIMVAVGSPTHLFIKFRPAKSVPYATCYLPVAVLGMSLLIAYLLMLARTRIGSNSLSLFIVLFSWSVIFYGALARPAFLYHLAESVGIAYQPPGPDPMKALVEMVSGEPLFRPWPNLTRWTTAGGVKVSPVEDGFLVEGDDTPRGHQIASPAVLVQPHSQVVLRVRGKIEQGKVCLGVRGQTSKTWLVSLTEVKEEYSFDNGDNQAIQLVVADCNPNATGNEPSRFIVYSISYAIWQKE